MDGMLGFPHKGSADVQVFAPNQPTAAGSANNAAQWRKRPGASMVAIFALGAGGNGGAGFVGLVSAAGGGGGGGAGAQAYAEIPACLVPDTLYIMVGVGGAAASAAGGGTVVALAPGAYSAQNVILLEAKGGNAGGTGSVGGGGGSGGSSGTLGNMPLACGTFVSIGGQSGNSAPGPGSPSNTSLPVTGLRVTGGCPGAGLNGSGVAGSIGGTFANPDSRVFPTLPGGSAGTSSTTPGGAGSNGLQVFQGPIGYWYGGTGGGSSHGSATGAGLFGGNGGNGGIGSGGGGGGGALTGSTQGVGGRGGDGIVVIVQW